MIRRVYESALWLGLACALRGAWLARLLGLASAAKLTRFCALRSRAHTREAFARLDAALRAGGYAQGEKPNAVWFHVASAGELEQAIPVARALHESRGLRFVLTYYSPSAEPFVKNFPALLLACGLPLDMRAHQRDFVRGLRARVKLEALLFVRYDLWPGLLRATRGESIRMGLLAATIRRTRGGLAGMLSRLSSRYVYAFLDLVFTVNASDVLAFERLAVRARVLHAGDPKWARARERAEALRTRGLSPSLHPLSALCRALQEREGRVLVFGSPHAGEHEVALRAAALEGALVVYVPHDPTPGHVDALLAEANDAGLAPIRFTELWAQPRRALTVEPPTDGACGPFAEHQPVRVYSPNALAPGRGERQVHNAFVSTNIVFVDAVGVLAEIYSLADVAIVGGGFDGALHNTLEPAAHPVPVLFGSRTARSPEAEQLVHKGAALAFDEPEAMFQFLRSCVRVSAASATDSKSAGPRLALLRLRSLELFKQVPSTSEVVSCALGECQPLP